MPRPRRASARPSSCTRLAGGKLMHLGILNSPSHVHVPGCAHAEEQEKRQHAKAGFGFKQRA